MRTEILIAGGGTGAVAAALAATDSGCKVIMTEETDWIGGQLTSQMVPPDENQWIEQYGRNDSYHEFRRRVREYYLNSPGFAPLQTGNNVLNPGGGSVSELCFEPAVGVKVLESMLAGAVADGKLVILLNTRIVGAETEHDRIKAVVAEDVGTGERRTIESKLFIDGTELGDLLKLSGTEYVTGAESRAETGEPHAPDGKPEPENVQAFTWCMAMAFDHTGKEHPAEKPHNYDFWRNFIPPMTPPWPGRLLDFQYSRPFDLHPYAGCLKVPGQSSGEGYDFWKYRKIRESRNYTRTIDDVTVINWPQNDYLCGGIIDKTPEETAFHLNGAKELTLSLFHWLRTEAPRPDGGNGYPQLYPASQVSGTADGLAKAPYIRESRRLKALFTVSELEIGEEARGGRDSAIFADSVGVGSYRIDLHPSADGKNYIDIASRRFQIPFRSLVPVRMKNLLAAAKNIGTTHISNGCYRLHPVEWSIGEAAGCAAALCLNRHWEIHALAESREHITDLQGILEKRGVCLRWELPQRC